MKTIEISIELAKRLVKGNAYKGANALQLADAWSAMEELEVLLTRATKSNQTQEPQP